MAGTSLPAADRPGAGPGVVGATVEEHAGDGGGVGRGGHQPASRQAWRIEYNTYRPHSSLGGLTPAEFAERRTINQPAPPKKLDHYPGARSGPCGVTGDMSLTDRTARVQPLDRA